MSTLLTWLAWFGLVTNVAAAQPSDAERLARLSSRFGIPFVAPTASFKDIDDPRKNVYLSGDPAPPPVLHRYLDWLEAEVNLLPANFMKASKLKGVVLCQHLTNSGSDVDAVVSHELRKFYADMLSDAENPYSKHADIIHELYHGFDSAIGRLFDDPEWAALNAPGFKYGIADTRNSYIDYLSFIGLKPGFLNYYSTRSLPEDKAEVFSNMILNYVDVESVASHDRIVHAKVELMKRRLARYMKDFSPAFWKRMAKRKIWLEDPRTACSRLHHAGQLEAGLQCFKKEADGGSSYAAFRVSAYYRFGQAVDKSPQEEFKWAKRSGELGGMMGMEQTASMYLRGSGVEKNVDEGLKWAEKAADLGSALGARFVKRIQAGEYQ